MECLRRTQQQRPNEFNAASFSVQPKPLAFRTSSRRLRASSARSLTFLFKSCIFASSTDADKSSGVSLCRFSMIKLPKLRYVSLMRSSSVGLCDCLFRRTFVVPGCKCTSVHVDPTYFGESSCRRARDARGETSFLTELSVEDFASRSFRDRFARSTRS